MKNERKIFIIICAAILVAVIAVVCILIGKSKSNDKKDNSSTRSYTQSEIDEIADWWNNDVKITQDGNFNITQ